MTTDDTISRSIAAITTCESESPVTGRHFAGHRDIAIAGLPRGLDSKYQLLSKLGEGGMATVFKARHKLTRNTVAIKILHEQTELSLRRFQQEAAFAVRLAHPNVVVVHDFDIADDVAYLVMEYVEGRTLSSVIATEGKIEPGRFSLLAADICAGLEYAHERGVIHRDIKPSNILLTHVDGREVAKIADFGVAKSADFVDQALTQTGEILGTPLYMSPEQCAGQPATKESDIYAFGCVMYEMLSGRPPMAGANVFETIHRRVHEKPRQFDAGLRVPEHIEKAVLKCLEQNPQQRFPNPNEISRHIQCDLRKARSSAHLVRSRISFGMFRLQFMIALLLCPLAVAGLCFGFMKEHRSTLPKDRLVVSALARDAFCKGDLRLAERAFTQLAEMNDPNKGWRAGALEYLAILNLRKHEVGKAANLTEEASELWRQEYGERSLYSSYGDITAARFYLNLGELPAAERHLERGLRVLTLAPRTDGFEGQRETIVDLYTKLYSLKGKAVSGSSKDRLIAIQHL